jgi:hypothetical protein
MERNPQTRGPARQRRRSGRPEMTGCDGRIVPLPGTGRRPGKATAGAVISRTRDSRPGQLPVCSHVLVSGRGPVSAITASLTPEQTIPDRQVHTIAHRMNHQTGRSRSASCPQPAGPCRRIAWPRYWPAEEPCPRTPRRQRLLRWGGLGHRKRSMSHRYPARLPVCTGQPRHAYDPRASVEAGAAVSVFLAGQPGHGRAPGLRAVTAAAG